MLCSSTIRIVGAEIKERKQKRIMVELVTSTWRYISFGRLPLYGPGDGCKSLDYKLRPRDNLKANDGN